MKRSIQAMTLAGALCLLDPLPAIAAIAHPGYSGLISTPTADVLPEGALAFSFSWVDGPETYLRPPLTNRLYTVTAGILPGLEVTLRLTEMVGWHDPTVPGVTYGNDRMLSAKYQLPLPESLPRVAVGMQDIASANLLAGIVADDPRLAYGQAMTYGILGDSFGNWSWHVGIAESRAFTRGWFGGLEAQVLPSTCLLVEHDGTQVNWGIRITPLPSLHLQASRLRNNTWGLSSTLKLYL